MHAIERRSKSSKFKKTKKPNDQSRSYLKYQSLEFQRHPRFKEKKIVEKYKSRYITKGGY